MTNNNSNGQQANLGFVFTVGLLAGYVASLIIPERAQEKAKEQLGESAKRFKDTVTDPENFDKIKSMVGGAAPDLMNLYMETRKGVMDELSNTKESWENLNKKKYGEVVKKALDTLAEDQKIPTAQLKTLQKYLENDYQTFRSA